MATKKKEPQSSYSYSHTSSTVNVSSWGFFKMGFNLTTGAFTALGVMSLLSKVIDYIISLI